MPENDFQVKNILSSIDKKTKTMINCLELRYPRMIHSEFITHRKFSRNGRSSRAVPVKKLSSEEIYVPDFMKNKSGMQATEIFNNEELLEIQNEWVKFAKETQKFAQWLADKGVHKQWANRPLEWFGYIDVLVTSTEWDNFFKLRLHPDAQPEAKKLAEKMDYEIKKIINDCDYQELLPGEWHIPYISGDEKYSLKTEKLLDLSVARCARVSFSPFDGNASYEKEYLRAELLRLADPMHASPFEHQAYVGVIDKDYNQFNYDNQHNTYELSRHLRSNFNFPWVQYRKIIERKMFLENFRK